VCAGNGVPDDHAGRTQLAVYIRSSGEWNEPTRRVVEAVHEIAGVSGGRPRTRALHLWDEAADRFVTVNEPKIVSLDRWAALARDHGRAAISSA